MNKTFKTKKYRSTYDKYVTNVFSYNHDLKKLQNEYEGAFKLWTTHLSVFLKPFSKSAKVLDVGCGLGHTLYFFKKYGFTNTLGIDISEENIAVLKHQGFNTKKTDAFEFLKTRKNTFDIVTIFDVIEHFSKDEGLLLLSLIKGALKKNGIVIIETLNGNHPFASKAYFDDITHEVGFTPRSLGTLFELANFKRRKIFTTNSFYIWHPNPWVYFFRKTVMLGVANITEILYKILALSQGVILKECKPVLIGIGYKV